uniref:Uncharacterized protein n=2 Tax=Picea TaxID=3328 RepID=A0A101LXF5_PICGL|nr:hypothetical protein ABT39_MTgene6140 [Picea glauca]QHR92796.1 hypothetical protein Q903MT_gene6844 [Picea sitchensis]
MSPFSISSYRIHYSFTSLNDILPAQNKGLSLYMKHYSKLAYQQVTYSESSPRQMGQGSEKDQEWCSENG